MLQSEVATRVKSNLADVGANFFTTSNIDEAIQDGYSDIISLLRPLTIVKSINFISQRVYYDLYNTITDYLHVLSIFNNNTNRWLEFKSIKWLEGRAERWELASGQPIVFTVLDFKYIALYPRLETASGSMDIFYKRKGEDLTSGSTISILDINESILEWYATLDLLEQIEEFEKASQYLNLYVDAVKTGQHLIDQRVLKDLIFQFGGGL